MYNSTIRRGRIFNFLASKATLNGAGTNSPPVSSPIDWSGNYAPIINNIGNTESSGWKGDETTLNPYRLVLDGVNDYLNTGHTPALTDKWSIEMWIKIPNIVGSEITTIWGTNGTGNGYWMPSFYYSKSNKKLTYGHDYYGNSYFEYGTIASHTINPGDIVQIALVFDGCKHVQLYLNSVILMDAIFTLTPSYTSSNLIGANVPATPYPGYGNIEVISCSIFSKLLSYTEILRSYQGIDDPLYKVDISQMSLGDHIPCRYTAVLGQVGYFSELGTCSEPNIPIASSAAPNGSFYWIYVGKDYLGRKKFIADRNIQHSISWDTLNSAGIISEKIINNITEVYTDNLCLNQASYLGLEPNGSISPINTSSDTPDKAFNGILSGIDYYNPVGTTNKRIVVQFSSTKKIRKLKIYPYYASNTYGPYHFYVIASNDKINWVKIPIQTYLLNAAQYNNDECAIINGMTFCEILIDNTKSYIYWGLHMYDISGNAFTTLPIVEIQMMEMISKHKANQPSVRLLSGGISATDTDNEWDKIIVGSTLGGKITAGDTDIWNAFPNVVGGQSWLSTTGANQTSSTKVLRPGASGTLASRVEAYATNNVSVNLGFRPVLLLEQLVIDKYLIKNDSNYYSIKPEYYDDASQNFLPLTLSGGVDPNKSDIDTFGFDSLDLLLSSITKGEETFKPIDKLDNKFELIVYRVS